MKTLFTLALALLCFIPTSWSQVAGDTDEITHAFTFDDQLNDVNLDPSPNIGAGSRQAIILNYATNNSNEELQEFIEDLGLSFIVALFEELGVDIPSEVVDFLDGVGDFAGPQVNPSLGVVASVDYGAYYEVNSIGNADIGVDYPVEVRTVYPEPNTFGCGDQFTIETFCDIPNSPNLDIQPPFYNLEIGPILENLNIALELGISVSFCLGTTTCCDGCWITPPIGEIPGIPGIEFSWNPPTQTIYSFDVPIPELPPLLNFCEDAFEPGANTADLFGCTLPGEADPFLEITQDLLDIFNNSNNPPTDYKIAEFSPNKVSVFPPDLPIGAPPLPEFLGDFYKVTDSDLSFTANDEGRTLNVGGTKTDIARMSFDALSLLDFAGVPTSASLGGGLGSIDLGDIAPVFQVDQEMEFEFKPVVHLQFDLGEEMDYEIHDPNLGHVSSGFGQIVDLIAGQSVVATYPEDLSDPSEVSNTYSLDGDFTTLTDQSYFTSFDINFLELAFLGEEFTLFSTNIGKEETSTSPDVLQDHTFKLNGFQSFNKDPFTLDPEYPIINVDYLAVEDVVNIGGGERGVVYKATFSNGGDVKLNDVRLELDLDETYGTAMSFSVECIHSDDIMLDGDYDGNGEVNLIAANMSLEIGESASVEILVKVKPEISDVGADGCFGTVDYDAMTIAYGTSPIGTNVESNIYHCTDERTADDIIAPVDLGASIITQLSDYTVYGWEELRFDKPEQLSKGNAGSSYDVVFENVSLQDGIDFEIWGDVHAGDSIEILGESNIVVDYIQAGYEIDIHNVNNSSVTVTGAISENSDCVAVMPEENLMIPLNNSNEKLVVGNGQSTYLAPGQYKEVRLKNNSTLTMSSGVYDIEKWLFHGDNSTVNYLDGPITINLDKWQTFSNDNLSFNIADGMSTEDIMYNYLGEQQTKFISSFVQGSILAPNAEVEFSEGSALEGACYAQKVNFQTGSYYTGHKFLEALNINPACQDAIPREAPVQRPALKLESSVSVFPNPFINQINVDFELDKESDVEINIYNLSGQVVYSEGSTNYSKGQHRIEVNPSNVLQSGMYIIYVRIGDEIIANKVIKLSL